MSKLNVKGHLWLPAHGAAATFHATRGCPTLKRLIDGGTGSSRRSYWEDARTAAEAAEFSRVRRCSCTRRVE